MRRSRFVPNDPPKGSEIQRTPCMHKPLSLRIDPVYSLSAHGYAPQNRPMDQKGLVPRVTQDASGLSEPKRRADGKEKEREKSTRSSRPAHLPHSTQLTQTCMKADVIEKNVARKGGFGKFCDLR
jgi:hypothetical protein